MSFLWWIQFVCFHPILWKKTGLWFYTRKNYVSKCKIRVKRSVGRVTRNTKYFSRPPISSIITQEFDMLKIMSTRWCRCVCICQNEFLKNMYKYFQMGYSRSRSLYARFVYLWKIGFLLTCIMFWRHQSTS